MALGITGDFAQLRETIEAFDHLATSFQPALASAIGRAQVGLAQNQFLLQKDPYGSPWKPSQRVQGIWKRRGRRSFGSAYTLIDTGRLFLAFRSAGGVDHVLLINDEIQANILNYGWPREARHPPPALTARAFIPEEGKGWGPIWEPELDRVAEELLENTFAHVRRP